MSISSSSTSPSDEGNVSQIMSVVTTTTSNGSELPLLSISDASCFLDNEDAHDCRINDKQKIIPSALLRLPHHNNSLGVSSSSSSSSSSSGSASEALSLASQVGMNNKSYEKRPATTAITTSTTTRTSNASATTTTTTTTPVTPPFTPPRNLIRLDDAIHSSSIDSSSSRTARAEKHTVTNYDKISRKRRKVHAEQQQEWQQQQQRCNNTNHNPNDESPSSFSDSDAPPRRTINSSSYTEDTRSNTHPTRSSLFLSPRQRRSYYGTTGHNNHTTKVNMTLLFFPQLLPSEEDHHDDECNCITANNSRSPPHLPDTSFLLPRRTIGTLHWRND